MANTRPSTPAPNALLDLFVTLTAARHIDTLERRYAARGQAPFHVSGFGHAASAALAGYLQPEDYLHLHYRDKALMLARGITARDFFLALFCKQDSNSHGRQLNALMSARHLNILSVVGTVGNNALQSVGIAASIVHAPGAPIVLCSMGDGTTQQGEVLEAIAEASRAALPVLFLVHDNEYSISTSTARKTFFSMPDPATGEPPAHFHGVPIVRINGKKPALCLAEFGPLVHRVRQSRQPLIIVMHVDRLDDHSNADDQSLYRPQQTIDLAKEQADPLLNLRHTLLHDGLATAAQLDELTAAAQADVEQAAAEALAAAEPIACLELEPPATTTSDSLTPTIPPQPTATLTLLESLRETLAHHLEHDPRVVVCGQDIEDPKGDIFGVTRGLSTRFPGRVLNAPLSESTIIGTAIGRALAGQLPVAFLPFVDFLPLAFNQVVLELATMEWRTAGTWPCPMIIMAICGGYKGGLGPFHAQTMEGFATHIPGLNVVMPGNAEDAAGLLQQAFQSPRPTLFLYPKSCLNDRNLARPVAIGAPLPLPTARIVQPGNDVTIVSWGAPVPLCLQAAAQLAGHGASAEVIDLCTLAPWDYDTVAQSVSKTGHLVIVHEDNVTGGFGAEIIARLAENGITARFRRVTRPDVPIPCHYDIQLEVLPSTQRIFAEVADLLGLDTTALAPSAPQTPADVAPATDPHLYTVYAFGLSPSDDQVRVLQWHVAPGDTVAEGSPLAEIEADKSSGELDCPVAGTVEEILYAGTDSITVGTPLLVIRTPQPVAQHAAPTHAPITVAIAPTAAPLASVRQSDRPSQTQRPGSAASLAVIGAIASATGSLRLTNDELSQRFDMPASEIHRKIGITSRPVAPAGTTPADLAWQAVQQLLESGDLQPDQLSQIIVSTSTVNRVCPSIACDILARIQQQHPQTRAMAFDMLATCTGWLYALRLAGDHLQHNAYRHGVALVVTTELLSPLVNPEDFGTSISFGDAATATLVHGPDAPRPAVAAPIALHPPEVTAMGDSEQSIMVPAMNCTDKITMNGRAVRQLTVPAMAGMVQTALTHAGLTTADLAAVLAHQSNHRILADLAAALDLPADKVPSNMNHLGNTSSCTLPLLLADLRRQSTLQPGSHIGFTAFGGGYTFGAAVGKVLD